MRIVAVIAARMDSSRLPGKAMMPILGKPMLERMIERIRGSRYVQHIVIATTHLASDDILAGLAERLEVGCYRGKVDDVLGRIREASAAAGADLVVELLGDNPLVHSTLIDDVLEFARDGSYDYSSNVTIEHVCAPPNVARFPVGIRAEVYTRGALERCERFANTNSEREHSTSYFYNHPEIFKLGYLEARGKWQDLNRPELTFAVNYRENYEMVSRIFESCYPDDPNFTLNRVIRAFDGSAELHGMMGTPR